MPLALRWLAPAVVICAGTATAADAPDALIRRLGDPVYSVRERASAELARSGPAGLLAAEAAARTSPDAEVRARAAAAAEVLRRAVEQAPLLAAKRVPLDYADRPVGEALADLAKRTGLTLKLDAGTDGARPVTVNSEPVPAWEAVERFRRAAGLVEVSAAEVPGRPAAKAEAPWTAYSGGEPTAPAEHAGLVPVVFRAGTVSGPALPAERGGAVRVQALPALFPGHRVVRGAGQVLLALDVTPPAGLPWSDPRVRVLRAEDETGRPIAGAYTAPAAVPEATDDPVFLWAGRNKAVVVNGQVVFLNEGPNAGETPLRPNPRVVLVPLLTEDRAVRRLRVLEGEILATVLTPNQPVAVADLRADVDRLITAADGSTLVVTRVGSEKTRRTVSVKWEGQTGNPGGMRPGRLWDGPAGRLVFRDAAGAKLAQPTQTGTSWTTNWQTNVATATFDFQFPADGPPPATLTLLGTKPVAVGVPFTLRDVPMP